MKEVPLINTARSRMLHIAASSVQAHIWYHDDYVATLCGQWLQVGDLHTRVNLDDVDSIDRSLCSNCRGRYLHVC